MKNKSLLVVLFVFAFLVSSATHAFALTVQVDNDGVISFYDQVLGRADGGKRKRREKVAHPQKIIRPSRDQVLRVSPRDKRVEVSVESERRDGSRRGERMDSDRVNLRFPAFQSIGQAERAEKEREHNRKEVIKKDVERLREGVKDRVKDKREFIKNRVEQKREVIKDRVVRQREYLKKLREQRRERGEELLRLDSRFDGDTQKLELRSRNVKARLNGADFQLDPDTNEVMLVTPSGKEKELNHLPDQAIERMKSVGSSFEGVNEPEVDVEYGEDGAITYSAKVKKTKKLFGLFNRNIDTRVALDDETGEVTQTELPTPGLMGRLFDLWSI